MGVASSKLPAQGQESTTVGGYGELHYNEPDGSGEGMLDFHRFVIYLGHGFNEDLSFKSEIELEHTKIEAGSSEGGELAIEQAYLDWHFSRHVGFKAGILLPPIGIINQVHEPPTFHGVERPSVDRTIIPTTWREAGAGIYGSILEQLTYQFYLTAGLKAKGFSGSGGIRGGRQEALESSPINPSLSGRLDYVPMPQLKLAASFFVGNTTGGNDSLGKGTLSILSGDVQYSSGEFSVRAVGAFESISDAEKINAAFASEVADQIYGFYVEGAYNLLPLLVPDSDHSCAVFTRYEKYNTQAKVTGFAARPEYDRSEIVVGATYKPTYNTAFKFDYQFLNNAARANTKQLNIGIGYSF